jgi:hypothetical protein
MQDQPPACWVVTDGGAGNETQALGLAEAIGRLAAIDLAAKRIRPTPFAGDALKRIGAPPFPALWIGCGRAAAALTIAAKRRNPATYTVQIQNPRAPLGRFDLVVAPAHDGLVGDNVITMIGAPNRIAAPAKKPRLPEKTLAVLVGGPNRAFRLGRADGRDLAAALRALADGGARLLITTSRRTPPEAADALERGVKDRARLFWRADCDSPADNPYPRMLAEADAVLVTEDSVNMASEAASAGLPVLVAPLRRRRCASARKFDAFHDSLRARGVARAFSGHIELWTPEPLKETDRVAAEIVRRWRSQNRVR